MRSSVTSPQSSSPGRRQPRKPRWLKIRLPEGEGLAAVRAEVAGRGLATVCDEARCPNRGVCYAHRTVTVMVLGDRCTRNCRFCGVRTARRPGPPDPDEPRAVAEALTGLGMKYVVLTMVTRDDLPDFGAGHVVACVEEIKSKDPTITVELLGSDFGGDPDALARVASSPVDVLAHNVEVVPRLTPLIRDQRASYARSLEVLRTWRALADPGVPTKSSIILGLGETEEEVLQVMADLRGVGVDILTLGQYLQPTPRHAAVARYVTPEEFQRLEALGHDMGFAAVVAGPLVRSSYLADQQLTAARGALGRRAGDG